MKEKNPNKNKLSNKHKAIVIKMIAAFKKDKEIIDFLKRDYGISITSGNVAHYRRNRKPDIRLARKSFLDDLEVLPVADKAHRILKRQQLINDLMKKENLWIKHYSAQTGVCTHVTGNHVAINKLLDSIKDELEPIKHSMPGIEEILAKHIQRGEELAKKYSQNRDTDSDVSTD